MKSYRFWAIGIALLGCKPSQKDRAGTLPLDTLSVVVGPAPNQIAPELPGRMRAALDQFAPGFERFDPQDYTPDLIKSLTDRPSYRAEGDFNGDGLPDLGLFGRDKTRELVVALVSMPDSTYKVFQLKEWGRPPLYNHNINIWLSSVDPGKVQVDYPDIVDSLRPTTLPHGGIGVNYAGVSETFYWNGTGFLSYTLAED